MNNVYEIWKFPLKVLDEQHITAPHIEKVLSVQVQFGVPCLWALVDPRADKEPYAVRVYGTGNPIPYDVDKFDFVDTFQLSGGELVFHVFIGR